MRKKECPGCGWPTPEPGMRCRDRLTCAQRADYAYIHDATHGKPAHRKRAAS